VNLDGNKKEIFDEIMESDEFICSEI